MTLDPKETLEGSYLHEIPAMGSCLSMEDVSNPQIWAHLKPTGTTLGNRELCRQLDSYKPDSLISTEIKSVSTKGFI